ncbi:MAG: N-6 DNA methylase [Cyclobacteriaceae bacterium]
MEVKEIIDIDKRKNGVYYTPENLAKYLAEPLINGTTKLVFDPAYGEGSLLLAAESIFKKKMIKNASIELFGSDIHPVNGLLTHLPKANLKQSDFFSLEDDLQFDIILSNPPYVRHQSQSKELIQSYRRKFDNLQFLSNSSDLWAYFLVKSISHLKAGGSIGLIIPWAFLQADYAQDIRSWLIDKFENIKVLALNHPYFEEESAQERVVIIWLSNKDHITRKIEFAFARDIASEIAYRELERTEWNSYKVVGTNYDLDSIFNRISNEMRFSKFGTLADTRIGVVTGANAFFIRKEEELTNLGFEQNQLKPIVTSAKELPSLITNGDEGLKRLVCITENDKDQFSDFIQNGEQLEFDQRSHSKMRKPWFAISPGRIPDAFFPYRVGKIPYMVLNTPQIQSTNSIHRIYFKEELTDIEVKWIIVSMLSTYGQLSMEANAKTYGRGMLKMEPGALGKVLVYSSNDNQINDVYDQVIARLGSEEKEVAVQISTNFIDRFLEVSEDLKAIANEALENIKMTRKRQ